LTPPHTIYSLGNQLFHRNKGSRESLLHQSKKAPQPLDKTNFIVYNTNVRKENVFVSKN